VWFILTSLRIVKPIFLPSIGSVMWGLYHLFATGEVLADLGTTLMRWVLGLLIGVAIGVPVGMLMGYSDKIYNALELVVDFFRSIPAMTLFPLFLVFLGLGNAPKVAVAAWGTFLYVLVSSMYGVKHSREARLTLAKTLRATRVQTFVKFIFPDALPEIAGGVRIGISLSLVLVVAAEMIMGTRFGLGKRIYDAALVYDMSGMYATIIVAGLLGFLSNKAFLLFENRIVHWGGK